MMNKNNNFKINNINGIVILMIQIIIQSLM